MLVSQKNLNTKQPSRTGLQSVISEKKERQIDALAGAICRFLGWRKNQLDMREARKIKAMLTRLRNRERRRTQ